MIEHGTCERRFRPKEAIEQGTRRLDPLRVDATGAEEAYELAAPGTDIEQSLSREEHDTLHPLAERRQVLIVARIRAEVLQIRRLVVADRSREIRVRLWRCKAKPAYRAFP